LRYVATSLDVIAFEGPRIREITAFATPEIFERFGLSRLLE
jgi:hypothetical protein